MGSSKCAGPGSLPAWRILSTPFTSQSTAGSRQEWRRRTWEAPPIINFLFRPNIDYTLADYSGGKCDEQGHTTFES
jgi:hypothetical protein